MVQEILIGPERRRRWSDEQKIAIVVEAASGDVSVSDVARRHGITRQQIYQWRSDIHRGRLLDGMGGPFLAVEFVPPSSDEEFPATKAVSEDLSQRLELKMIRGFQYQSMSRKRRFRAKTSFKSCLS